VFMGSTKISAFARALAMSAVVLASCSAADRSFLPGLPSLVSSGLPDSCSGPDSYKPQSPCAKDLAEAQKDENFRLRDTRDVRHYLDDACEDESAWQPGSTCHLVTDALQHAAAGPPAIGFQINKNPPPSGPTNIGPMPALP
jgi:hypothetical protein